MAADPMHRLSRFPSRLHNMARLTAAVARHKSGERNVPESIRAIGEELLSQAREVIAIADALECSGAER